MVIIMALPLSYPIYLYVDLVHIADMDESYGTDVDDEYYDNHDYDDNIDDDIDDDNDHKKDSYTAAGAAPNAGAASPQTPPD